MLVDHEPKKIDSFVKLRATEKTQKNGQRDSHKTKRQGNYHKKKRTERELSSTQNKSKQTEKGFDRNSRS